MSCAHSPAEHLAVTAHLPRTPTPLSPTSVSGLDSHLIALADDYIPVIQRRRSPMPSPCSRRRSDALMIQRTRRSTFPLPYPRSWFCSHLFFPCTLSALWPVKDTIEFNDFSVRTYTTDTVPAFWSNFTALLHSTLLPRHRARHLKAPRAL
ncbi:hypothetical protein HYPSUDRAFT_585952 [Hypholoma sublateritium FD-334 SS-4]|uniref:Uncharacterized protein n=1 Tax=Hypholoma sublateritium (strain FD-334 SS-4) TaxID=945553 RepID=A0A0D2NX63_HYPSF|nr:hypothetical protein HYPSUDRAFT_585952 [Hypholoma sublateritium FD-334 SS-4]